MEDGVLLILRPCKGGRKQNMSKYGYKQSCLKLTKQKYVLIRNSSHQKTVFTYIMKMRDALILVVVKLFPQVFVLCRLKTHCDHLCTGQHLAAFDAISFLNERLLFCPCVFGEGLSLSKVDGRRIMLVLCCSQDEMDQPDAHCLLHVRRQQQSKLRLYTASSSDS